MSPRHTTSGAGVHGVPDTDSADDLMAALAAPTAVQFPQARPRTAAPEPEPAPGGADAGNVPAAPGRTPPEPLPLHPATSQYVPYSAPVPTTAFPPTQWTTLPPSAILPPIPPPRARRPAGWRTRRTRIEELEAENTHLRAWLAHLGAAEPLRLLLETDRLRRELAALQHAVTTARAELTATHAAVTRTAASR
ncbi:hypothetical protein LO762_13415 [Actinocorallia sp. API 0066]|uniref:hypothetical protein n=1 Tax=Actinocorallia sp. API 0066 TaxID=2896846 RepID=UPI001E557ECD|nr:hypothetical protein [Actinocorallia sp. API 0066]MCD0450184.1 hypothetical protein [Actinocorallia sp. API 0066]